jgi:branched-chain amino acid transport system substrate-binding protein
MLPSKGGKAWERAPEHLDGHGLAASGCGDGHVEAAGTGIMAVVSDDSVYGGAILKSMVVRAVSFLAVFSICAVAFCACSKDNVQEKADDGTVKIGVAYPIETVDSENPYYREGLEFARDEINKSGGVLGKPIELVFKDDRNSADTAMQIAQSFYNEGITAVVGHKSSTMCYYAEDIYEINKVLMLSPLATSDILFDWEYQYIFRMIPNNAYFAGLIADYAEQSNFKCVAIYFTDDEYGRSFADKAESAFADKGIVVADRLSSVVSSQVAGIAFRWKAFGVEALIVGASISTGAEQIRILRENFPALPVIGSHTFAEAREEEAILSGNADPGNVYFTGFDMDTIRSDFLHAYSEKYGHAPNTGSIFTYESVRLIADAMNATGTVDGTALAEYLSHLKDYDGITGSLTYRPENHIFQSPKLKVQQLYSREE